MKIVIDGRESGTSTGRYIDKLVEYLHRLNPPHEIVVLTKKHRVEFVRGIASRFEVVVSEHKEFTFAEQLGFLRQIRALKADLVHFGMVQQPMLYQGKIVTTMHDLTGTRFRNPSKNWLIFTIKQRVYRGVNRIAARKSASIITPSEFVKKDVARFARISDKKIVVTYEAADVITEPSAPVEELRGQPFLLYVGRPSAHKNLKKLIDAFTIIRQSHLEMCLVFAGKKDQLYEELERYAAKTNVREAIKFTGFVSEGQLRWLYEHADAYVFPSLSEGFGLPGLEAMAQGCPVVSSNATCLPEVYGDAAHYFDPKDTKEMAVKVLEVLEQEDLRNSMIQKGYAQAKKYSWEKMARETLGVYQSVNAPSGGSKVSGPGAV